MRFLRAVIVAALVFPFSVSFAFCCSCSNSTPIQKTSERYQERAVFTAHIVQSIGGVSNWDGKRVSGRVLAVVHERHWGVPWYWPKVVVLDGSYPCDTVMEIGEEYLVSGFRERYGVVAVNGCSRTQPMKTAQVDLRTLDGSHCATPGGTVIGRISRANDGVLEKSPGTNVAVNFLDQRGKSYTAHSDGDGIYELRRLAPGTYIAESLAGQDYYASSREVGVEDGICTEVPIVLRNYSLRGRLLPGLVATVNLVDVSGQTPGIRSESLEPDGRFYFRAVPDGEYVLAVKTWLEDTGTGRDFYYPGTYDRQKAARLRIVDHVLPGGGTLDFDAKQLPIDPIPVRLDPPGSGRFFWRVQLVGPKSIVGEKTWVDGGPSVLLYGERGGSYRVRLYGFPKEPPKFNDCTSETTNFVVRPGMATIHIAVPANCN